MNDYHRVQILLEHRQYEQLRALARTRSLQQGERVSVSQVIREFLDQALEDEQHRWQRAREALEDLFALSEEIRARWPGPWPEDWLTQMRQERTDEIFEELLGGH
ncbi:MAG TPA: hypothetical protein ENK56_07510 [Chloroflexi bacterium]|nr:hypothetical protein [Chloroflexota bacterium]